MKLEKSLLNIFVIIDFFVPLQYKRKRNINQLNNKSIMKKLPKNFSFNGYYADYSLRLYIQKTPKRVRCYLIPTSASIYDYKQFEISKDYALFLLAGKLV